MRPSGTNVAQQAAQQDPKVEVLVGIEVLGSELASPGTSVPVIRKNLMILGQFMSQHGVELTVEEIFQAATEGAQSAGHPLGEKAMHKAFAALNDESDVLSSSAEEEDNDEQTILQMFGQMKLGFSHERRRKTRMGPTLFVLEDDDHGIPFFDPRGDDLETHSPTVSRSPELGAVVDLDGSTNSQE